MKVRQLFVKLLATLNWFEGIVHLIVSGVGLWGCIVINVYDARIMAPIVENFIFGIFSVLTGMVMMNLTQKK